ncbi:multiple organellar RNA editing factor 9, chloroplastic-like isoform X1 [Silene latifolia]|uniref:multiple organellar RNA editing factor 9, chloroplastic-like isoform X1 n=1 Tax=Silene latifolia TaxID=37657 RepID=UPI003D772CF2
MAISSSVGFKFSYPIVAPKMDTRDLVIPSSIAFKVSYPIVAPKMNMRGLVSIPVMKGVRCVPIVKDERSVSGSNYIPDPRYEGLDKSIAWQAALLVPDYPGSMMSRKLNEMRASIANTLGRGRDFRHFRVFLKPPLSDAASASSPDLIIRYYIQTLCQTMSLMSEEEAVKRIYSVATRHYFAFGAKVSPHIAELLKALPNVCAVHPDEFVDIKERRYPWDPFINGQALPYDGKYYPSFSNEELGMATQETLPNSYEELAMKN